MLEKFWLRRRYGKKLDVKNFSDLQKIFLLDERVKNNIDVLGNKTVRLLENKTEGVSLSLVDKYCYNYHCDKKIKQIMCLKEAKSIKKYLKNFRNILEVLRIDIDFPMTL